MLQVPLEKYFPEYTAGPDINKAAKYILWRFMQANWARLSVYSQ
jgi:guanine nucleotide-binding protein subunit alpha